MKSKFMKILPLAVLIVMGIVGAFFRAMELEKGYNNVTGLYKNTSATYVLPTLCLIGAVIALITVLLRAKTEMPFTKLYATTRGGAVFCVTAALAIFVAGVMRTVNFFSLGGYSRLLLGLLTIVCGICFLGLCFLRVRGQAGEMTQLAGVVPVFWACFLVILTFMEHPVEPIIQLYAYDLLAVCASLLALYGHCGRLYERTRDRLGLFGALLAEMLLCISVGGRLLSFVLYSDTAFLSDAGFRILCCAALFLYFLPGTYQLLLRLPYHNESEGPDQ